MVGGGLAAWWRRRRELEQAETSVARRGSEWAELPNQAMVPDLSCCRVEERSVKQEAQGLRTCCLVRHVQMNHTSQGRMNNLLIRHFGLAFGLAL